jgi:hypothetical protein
MKNKNIILKKSTSTSDLKAAKIRARWDKEVAEALKGKRYVSSREMMIDILGKKAYARFSK